MLVIHNVVRMMRMSMVRMVKIVRMMSMVRMMKMVRIMMMMVMAWMMRMLEILNRPAQASKVLLHLIFPRIIGDPDKKESLQNFDL